MSVKELGAVSRSGRVGECARPIRSCSSEPWPFPECQQEAKGAGGGRGGNWEMGSLGHSSSGFPRAKQLGSRTSPDTLKVGPSMTLPGFFLRERPGQL